MKSVCQILKVAVFGAETVTGGNDNLIKFIVYCTCTPAILQGLQKVGATSVLLPFPNESPASPTSFFLPQTFLQGLVG